MDELAEIRKRKLSQLYGTNDQLQEEMQLVQQIEALENIVKQKFTKDALQRYGNLKSAHPEKAIQLLALLGQLIEANNVEQITDEQLKSLLLRLTPEKKEFKINRI